MAITGGFGRTLDIETGITRNWILGKDGVKRWADTGEPCSQVRAEIRTARDITDEAVSYLVFVVDGKSMPYLHIPESMPDEALDRIVAKLNA